MRKDFKLNLKVIRDALCLYFAVQLETIVPGFTRENLQLNLNIKRENLNSDQEFLS